MEPLQDQTFDRLTKLLASPPTRRSLIQGLGALVAAGVGITQFGQRRSFERVLAQSSDNPEEQSVLLLEEIGRIVEAHDGNCSTLRKKTHDFEAKYKDDFDRLRVEEATWDYERSADHADTYGERRMAVVHKVETAIARCEAVSDTDIPAMAAMSIVPLAGLVAPAESEPDHVRVFAQGDADCTQDNHNFLVEAYCARRDSDWASPSFQWPAYCSSGDIDGSCDLCSVNTAGNTTNPGVCTQYWPQDCLDSDGQNLCDVQYHWSHGGTASAVCAQNDPKYVMSAPARCYSRESDWRSPEFPWEVFCPKGYVDHDCIDCLDSGEATQPEVCVHYWPQDCQHPEGNVCYVGFHVDDAEVCCHQNCPVHTSDCVISVFAVLYGSYECGGCMLSWCGSTSECIDHCTTEDCCDEACSSAPIPPPPGPVPERPTPVASPIATPVVPPPLPPGTPNIMPPPLPPGVPIATPVASS